LPRGLHYDNGSSVVTPQLGAVLPLDYEVCDPAIGGSACDEAIVPGCTPSSQGGPPCVEPTVLPAAAQLSQNGGTFPAKLLGETGPGADAASVSFGAAEYSAVLRDEQRLFRFGESDNELCDGREWGRGRGDRKRVAEFAERHYAQADEPSAGAVFARLGAVVSEHDRGTDEHLQLDGRSWAIIDIAAANTGTPAAPGGDFEPEPGAQPVEVRGRRDADLGLRLLSVAVRGGVFLRRYFGG